MSDSKAQQIFFLPGSKLSTFVSYYTIPSSFPFIPPHSIPLPFSPPFIPFLFFPSFLSFLVPLLSFLFPIFPSSSKGILSISANFLVAPIPPYFVSLSPARQFLVDMFTQTLEPFSTWQVEINTFAWCLNSILFVSYDIMVEIHGQRFKNLHWFNHLDEADNDQRQITRIYDT